MQAITPENAVIRSSPLALSTSVRATMLTMYMKLKARTACSTLSVTGWRPSRSGTTALGCSARTISRCTCLYRMIARIILMPPPVDPEHAAEPAQLRGPRVWPRRAVHQREVVGGVVDARQQREHHRDGLDRQAVEAAQAGIAGRKAAQAHDRKGMNQRLPRIHADLPQRTGASD